jgi:hypothetical protein
MGSMVSMGGFEVSSNSESAEEMVTALTGGDPEQADEPVVKVDRGKDVEEKPKDPAAVALGKRGGQASAASRAAAKDAKGKEAPAAKPTKADSEGQGKDGKAQAGAEGDEKPAAGEKPEKGAGKPRNDPEARVKQATDQLARERLERAEERARYERRLAAIEARVNGGGEQKDQRPEARQPQRQAPTADDPNDPEPKEDDFETFTDYTKALGRWAGRQEIREHQRVSETRARLKADTDHFATNVEKMFNAIAEHPEAEQIDPQLLQIRPWKAAQARGEAFGPQHVVGDEILRAAVEGRVNPAEFHLHFTRNPEDFRELMKLPNARAVQREMMRLAVRLEAAGAGDADADRPVASKAPPPFKPVGGGGGTADVDDSGDLDLDTFMKRQARKGK